MIKMSESYFSMPLALVPPPRVRRTMFGTSVGPRPVSFTAVHFPCISATVWPSVGALACWYIKNKLSLLEERLNHFYFVHCAVTFFSAVKLENLRKVWGQINSLQHLNQECQHEARVTVLQSRVSLITKYCLWLDLGFQIRQIIHTVI